MSEASRLVSPLSSAVKYGTALGLIMIITVWSSNHYMFVNKEEVPGYVFYIQTGITALCIVLSMIDHRRRFTGREMKYSEALGAGVITAAIGAVFLTVFTIVYFYFNEDVMKVMEDLSRKHLNEDQLKVMEDASKETSILKKALTGGMISFVMQMFMGFVSSIILAIFIRRKIV